MRKILLLAVILFASGVMAAEPPEPYGPVPTKGQLKWHELEYFGFVHFTINTFTVQQHEEGDEKPTRFKPTALDARQWAKAAKDAGMKGLILTAKHHDGFCLWPSKYTEYSVKNSPWKNGKGDLVREFVDSCKEFDLKVGFYLSPWDRNHAKYAKPEYVEYYHKQWEELLTNYGDVFEVWHDGANSGIGYYGGSVKEKRSIDGDTYYQFPRLWKRVRELHPDATIFAPIEMGPDIRWVGNEKGYAPDTCWAQIDLKQLKAVQDKKERKVLYGTGHADGTIWSPAEVDVSIRKTWFYDPKYKTKSLGALLDIYYNSVGKGCNLLLNIPPDKRGLFHEDDVKAIKELRAVLDDTFKTDLAKGKSVTASNVRGNDDKFSASKLTDGDRSTYWASDNDVKESELIINFGKETKLNRIRLQEYIQLGQRIAEFSIHVPDGDGWKQIAKSTTIGARKILRPPTVTTDKIKLKIEKSSACPTISTFEVYLATKEPAYTAPPEPVHKPPEPARRKKKKKK